MSKLIEHHPPQIRPPKRNLSVPTFLRDLTLTRSSSEALLTRVTCQQYRRKVRRRFLPPRPPNILGTPSFGGGLFLSGGKKPSLITLLNSDSPPPANDSRWSPSRNLRFRQTLTVFAGPSKLGEKRKTLALSPTTTSRQTSKTFCHAVGQSGTKDESRR